MTNQLLGGLLGALLMLCAPLAQPQTTTRPKISGISAVRISCDEQCNVEAFYSSLLPLSGDCRWCGRVPGTNVGRAETPFSVDDSQEILLSKSSPQPDRAGLAEISFSVRDISKLERYFVERDLKTTKSISGGALALDDPDGHHLRFVEVRSGGWKHEPKARGMRIIHAGFVVRDRLAMEHFYRDILGFKPYWHGGMRDDHTDWESFQVPDGTDWVEFMVNVPENADQRLRGIMNHIALGVPDIHAAQKQLLTNGMKLTEEPKIGRDGKWQLNLYDPDLTRVELMEFTPVEKPCCSEYTGPHPKP